MIVPALPPGSSLWVALSWLVVVWYFALLPVAWLAAFIKQATRQD